MVYLKRKYSSESLLCETSTHYYPSNVLSLKELSYWIAFSRVLGIGPVRFKLLLDAFHEDVEAAWHADPVDLARAGLDHKLIMKFVQQRATIIPEQELERLRRLRIHVITWKDQTPRQITPRTPKNQFILHASSHLFCCPQCRAPDTRLKLSRPIC